MVTPSPPVAGLLHRHGQRFRAIRQDHNWLRAGGAGASFGAVGFERGLKFCQRANAALAADGAIKRRKGAKIGRTMDNIIWK